MTRKSLGLKITTVLAIIAILITQFSANLLAKPSKIAKSRDKVSRQVSYQTDKILVKFKPKITLARKKSFLDKLKIGNLLKKIDLESKKQDIEIIKLKLGKSANQAVSELRKNSLVEYAELDRVRQSGFAPNDPSFSLQWGLNNTTTGADINAPEAWDIERGNTNPVVVAVIDSGVDLTHPDLVNNLWQNPGEIAGNSRDDDGNGFVDDVNGYNWAGISQLAHNKLIEIGYNRKMVAQSITGTGEPLTEVSLWLQRILIPSQPIKVHIRGSLNGRNLATATINYSDVANTEGKVTKRLNRSVRLTNGQTYYLVVSVRKNLTGYYRIGKNDKGEAATYNASTYAEGKAYTKRGNRWVAENDNDWYFDTNPNAKPHDDEGHGTHVAGIIGAENHNGVGVAGLVSGVKIMPLKVTASNDEIFASDMSEAIKYAIREGADIINMSIYGFGKTETEQDVINDAYNGDVVIFACSGNEGNSDLQYPASYKNVISVGNTDINDVINTQSTFNSAVDISAPGTSIYSTTPTYDVAKTNIGLTRDYGYMTGTSMAAPMAAGTAGLILAKHPDFKPWQIELILELFAKDLGASNWDKYYGNGRIDAAAGLTGDSIPPTNPVITSPTHPSSAAYYSNDDVTLNWTSTDNYQVLGYSYAIVSSPVTALGDVVETSDQRMTLPNQNSGNYYFQIKASDLFNNWSGISTFNYKIDKTRPATYALSTVTARRGQNATLRYRVGDTYSDNKATVRITITNLGHQAIRSYNLGLITINTTSQYNVSTSGMAVGNYYYKIFATDQAGNTQSVVGSSVLSVY